MCFAACASITDECRRNVWKSKNLENNRNLENHASTFSQKKKTFLKIWKSRKILKIIKNPKNLENSQHFQIKKNVRFQISQISHLKIFRNKSEKKSRKQKLKSNFFFSMTKKILLIEIPRNFCWALFRH